MDFKDSSTSIKHLQRFGSFSYLSQNQLEILANNMSYLKFQQNQIIFNQGDLANSIFIIVSGSIQLTFVNKPSLVLKYGQFFGEGCLYDKNTKRSGTAKTLSKSCCLTISRDKIKKCLKGQVNNILHFCLIKWALKRSKIFKECSEILIQKLIKAGKIKFLQDNQKIFKQKEHEKMLVINLQGKIKNDIEIGDLLNFQTYQKKQNNQILFQNYIKKQSGHVFYLPFQKISQIIYGKKQSKYSKSSFTTNDTYSLEQSQLHQNNLELKHLFVLRCLKQQAKSKNLFLLVQKKTVKIDQYQNLQQSKCFVRQKFVLKCIQKKQIVQNGLQYRYIKEKQLLEINYHFSICRLIKTFKDEHYIYFLFKFYENGDFFKLLREIKIWNKQKIQFYTACLLLGIKKIHQQNIIFRNLKPQNILVDQDGYLVLYDFSKAKILKPRNGYRTYTIIGTPHYIAPQIIQGKGYSFAVDLWSLGIISYQILYGNVPFGTQSEDPYAIFQSIIFNELLFSKKLPNYEMREVIQLLLQKDCQKRELLQFEDIQNMNFYKNFDWSALQQKNLKAPFVLPKQNEQKQKKLIKDLSVLKYLQKQKKMISRPSKSKKDSQWDEVF